MQDLSLFFRALGDETRLRLVALLSRQEAGRALCVGRLAEELGVTTSSVSQHLRVLKDLGLVRAERRGYRLHYFLQAERLGAYQALIREHLGEGFVGHAAEACCGQEDGQPLDHCRCRGACIHPDERRDPEKCSPEQIRECHGEVSDHPCQAAERATEQME